LFILPVRGFRRPAGSAATPDQKAVKLAQCFKSQPAPAGLVILRPNGDINDRANCVIGGEAAALSV